MENPLRVEEKETREYIQNGNEEEKWCSECEGEVLVYRKRVPLDNNNVNAIKEWRNI